MKQSMRYLSGVGLAGDVDQVIMFDGKFTTGYRILDFVICPVDILNAEEVSARVLTEFASHNVNWNWASNRQCAWSIWNAYNTAAVSQFSHVDPSSIIVEDIFIDFSGDSGQEINWAMTVEKISMSDWEGALAMVQNRSQGSD